MGKFINGKKLCTVLFDVGREGRCFLVDIRNGEGGRRQSSLKKFDISAIGLYDMTSLFPLPVGTGCLYPPVNRYIYIYIKCLELIEPDCFGPFVWRPYGVLLSNLS